jgi:glucose-6-phosphate 1-dehydrogenase
MVVFGASGNLVRKKLIPALAKLHKRGLLSEQFLVLGCGRTALSDDEYRDFARQAVGESGVITPETNLSGLINKFYYLTGEYGEQALYERLGKRIKELDKRHHIDGSIIFYLAVPPSLYATIVEQLGAAELSCRYDPKAKHRVRIVVEKPFGRDSKSAVELNDVLYRCFDEFQIYRIDHYLGKETVQNILIFRFANAIFEPIWNRNYIDHVQVTIAETMGVADRAGYYDKAGALRDIFQNHALQMLSLVAMEPPISFDADHVRDEKVKLLRSIRPFTAEQVPELFVRGQYAPGVIDGQQAASYRDEPGVDRQSKTETFVAAKLFIDNWRWKDVPFYLRTGKRLAGKDTEIAITFKKVPHSLFAAAGPDDMPANVLTLQIQPEEGMSLKFQAKRPGSKICMGTLDMSFAYRNIFGIDMPDAYERLLLDCMLGDQTLFTRFDDVEAAWQLLTPVLDAWQADTSAPHSYPAGSDSFPEADALIESDGRKWRGLSEV